MKINNETVVGYDRVANQGLVVFTQSATCGVTDCNQTLIEFDSKYDCDAYQSVLHACWQRHIKSLREGYVTVVR
jgi:hypothetical protein